MNAVVVRELESPYRGAPLLLPHHHREVQVQPVFGSRTDTLVCFVHDAAEAGLAVPTASVPPVTSNAAATRILDTTRFRFIVAPRPRTGEATVKRAGASWAETLMNP